MNRPAPLTPEARIERAKKLLTEAVGELVEAKLAQGAAASEWVDQNSSPLGRRRHCELVREGKLPGAREGRRVLVRREDLNKYLEDKRAARPVVEQDDDLEGMIDAIAGGV